MIRYTQMTYTKNMKSKVGDIKSSTEGITLFKKKVQVSKAKMEKGKRVLFDNNEYR